MGFYRQSCIAENLALRARLLKCIRDYFGDHGFLEVETPCRIPAPAPEAYIDAQASGNWFLQPSPELWLTSPRQSAAQRPLQSGPRHMPLGGREGHFEGVYPGLSFLDKLG